MNKEFEDIVLWLNANEPKGELVEQVEKVKKDLESLEKYKEAIDFLSNYILIEDKYLWFVKKDNGNLLYLITQAIQIPDDKKEILKEVLGNE
jgi:lysylphosphatidylglycerol synthetase-like protein (DUF2156 family)